MGKSSVFSDTNVDFTCTCVDKALILTNIIAFMYQKTMQESQQHHFLNAFSLIKL